MTLAKLLINEKNFEKLTNSNKLTVYTQSSDLYADAESSFVILMNERQELFTVTNEPLDHEHWGELDRIAICYNENGRERLLQDYSQEKNEWRYKNIWCKKLIEIPTPQLNIYRETYTMCSPYTNFKEKIEADFALLCQSENKTLLIYCSEVGTGVQAIDDLEKIKKILEDTVKVD